MEYFYNLAIWVCIYLILGHSFNLVFGLGGMLNLAHISAYALGAYAVALLSTNYQNSWPVCLLVGMLLASVLAAVIAQFAKRLRGDYLAVGTLAGSSLINALLVNWKNLTNGVLGVSGIPRPVMGSISLDNNNSFLAFAATICGIILLVLWFVHRGSLGRALRAQAVSTESAQALGISVGHVRFLALWISAVAASLAGGLSAYYVNYVDPLSFSLTEMVFIVSIVIVGRPGSFRGVTAATIFLVLLPEPIRFVDLPPSIVGPGRLLIYAVVLFSVILIYRDRIITTRRTV